MRKGAMIVGLMLLPLLASAQAESRVMLFDFEAGTQDWWSNPWSGGKARVESAEGKFGKGLLAAWEAVPGGGNNVSPYLDEKAEWRKRDLPFISFWLRGDGTQASANFSVLCAGPEGKEIGYSCEVPLDNTKWRRFSLDMRTFWCREELPFESAKIRRILFGCSGTHKLWVDQIALEARQRPVPLEVRPDMTALDQSPELFAFDKGWLVRFDPTGLPTPVRALAEIEWPNGETTRATEQAIAEPITEEVLLWVPFPEKPLSPDQQGAKAKLNILILRNGKPFSRGSYQFPATFSLPPIEPKLGLLPTPKELTLLPGEEPPKLPEMNSIHAGIPRAALAPIAYLKAQLADRWHLRFGIDGSLHSPGTECSVVVTAKGKRTYPSEATIRDLRTRGPEAYWLRVDAGGVQIRANNGDGLRWGVMTLLQLVAEAMRSEKREIPALEITDWPSLPIRGITIPLPTDRWGYPNDAPVDPAFYEKFLLRTCLEHKLNTVVILVHQGMQYKRHPEINGPAAWPQETVRHLVETLKANGINVIPQLESLGHANWLVIPIKELREDGDTDTLCTRNPLSRKVLLDCYEEVIDVFKPTYFHMGLDEIRWQTLNKPEAERCKLCAGVDKRELFVEQVKMLRDWLVERKITPMMWGDMVLRAHNGGPPFQLADALERLPRDIVICNWSITLDQLSNHQFRSLGFPVIQSNSAGVSPAQAPYVGGNFFGVWAKHPWMTENAMGPYTGFSYLPVLTAAEYSWNLYPDALASDAPVDDAFFAPRMAAFTRLGLEGPVGPTETLAPGDTAALRPVYTGPARFLWDQPFAPTADKPLTLPVGKKASALYFLVAASVPQDQRAAFYKEFQKKDTWKGVSIGEFALRYEDGTEATRPLLYGFDVRDAVKTKLPFAYNAVGYWTDNATGRTWYTLQWLNPHPEKTIKEVSFRRGATAAQPLLRAASIGQ